ncbi:helix-turn-helix domain-containing protein [Paenibacillus elgii]|uniref:helix-turn-helix domain-containing protein n=1 Tax=Paenibacillus elgii TaxID=189691 RepID=UPI00203FE470|nr:helix-turn-helix transcriptional regulator [Paenibacillus elgii]MCM3271216.1 helix-turn-helix domain-containing protein [Paenibacillus elgii]
MAATLGDRIRLIRKTNRLSQIDFSNLISISQGTLSELGQEKYNPSLETIFSIHKVFKTDPSYLLLGDNGESAPKNCSTHHLMKGNAIN